MLESLTIQNIALIDRLSVDFRPGLLALTGETGAGKSIIIDAITLLLGGRASRDLIRSGTDRAFAEGVFSLDDCPQAVQYLKSQDWDTGDGSLTLAREISQSGRSVCRINGLSVPLSVYKPLTAMLMDIHGQHEHQSLMDEKQHLPLLDAFGGAGHRALLQKTSAAYHEYEDSRRALQKMQRTLEENRDRVDILEYQKQELEKAGLTAGEEDSLKQESDLFRNAEKIETQLRSAYENLYDHGALPSAMDSLRSASSSLKALAGFRDDLASLAERVENLYYEAEDAGITARDLLDELNYDEERVEYVSARLDLIHRLARKYGATTRDMLNRLAEINQTLEDLESAEDRTQELKSRMDKKYREYEAAAKELSASRKQIARQFEQKMEQELRQLNMEGTQFTVRFSEGAPSSAGMDQAVFLIAPNRGEAFQPLAQTASGGELSRIMLAIKALSAGQSQIPSMVFDEIDTGISGRTAQVVAEKMADIARYRQVFCVTHLPQIAAMADHQYRVEKHFDGQRTLTTLLDLDEAGRRDELSRMLGGAQADSESAKAHAQSLLDQAETYKQAHRPE